MLTLRWRAACSSSVVICAAFATAMFAGSTAASTFKTLYSFCSQKNCADGAVPIFGVLSDSNGVLYGITSGGGKGNGGTVYSLVPNNKGGYDYKPIYRFCSKKNCIDGKDPETPLVLDTNGNLYGATRSGGPTNNGVVYELIPNADHSQWSHVTLYGFCPSATTCPDGYTPFGPLTYEGAQSGALYDGTSPLYGTAQSGGNGNGGTGAGVLFRLKFLSGKVKRKETVLYNFCSQTDCPDGNSPFGVTIDASGNLYGPTERGGTVSDDGGILYEFAPKTQTFTVLYTFCTFFTNPQCADGQDPQTTLTWDAQGRLYGTTEEGGGGKGVIFRLTPKGTKSTEDVLYDFCRLPNCTDGALAIGVAIGPNGTIFGGTALGNKFPGTDCLDSNLGCGVLYQLKDGTYKVLHQFCTTSEVSCPDGGAPLAPNILIDSSGNMIGSAAVGGAHGHGTIWEYTP